MLTGPNGLLTQANDARTKTSEAGAKEKVQIAVASSWRENGFSAEEFKTEVERFGGEITLGTEKFPIKVTVDGQNFEVSEEGVVTEKGKSTTGGDTVTPGVIVTGSNKTYENNGTAVIPVGFSIVPGLNDVSQGLVISDDANDTETDKDHIVANGNQFVWIPVEKETFEAKFKRTEGYCNEGILQNRLSGCGEANAMGENAKITESTKTQQEAKNMYASVESNGGFYIGRYETGKQNENVVCKKGVTVYNEIIWGESLTEEGEKGAVYESRKFAGDNGYSSVVSTLCYGVQWDAALNFIDSNYITNEVEERPNCQSDSYVRNSTGKGNYNEDANTNEWKGTLIETGKLEQYSEKHIYDMAGNVWEWTMESSDILNERIDRGGACNSKGVDFPSSFRGSDGFDEYYNNVGFRLALYVK